MKTPRLLRPRLLLLRPSRAQRVYADISSLSCAPDVKEVVSGALDPDFDAVGSDSDDETNTMPCCGVKWDEDVGFAVVMCNRCCEWFHKGPLGYVPAKSPPGRS